jgi:hypothetical protein
MARSPLDTVGHGGSNGTHNQRRFVGQPHSTDTVNAARQTLLPPDRTGAASRLSQTTWASPTSSPCGDVLWRSNHRHLRGRYRRGSSSVSARWLRPEQGSQDTDAVAREHLSKRERATGKEIAVLLMASKFRQNASSDRQAIIQAIDLYYEKPKDWQNKLRQVQYRLAALHKDGFIPSATVGAFAEWEWQMR